MLRGPARIMASFADRRIDTPLPVRAFTFAGRLKLCDLNPCHSQIAVRVRKGRPQSFAFVL